MKKNESGRAIRLERPLEGGVRSISVNDPTFSDLAGVLTGMKPVTYTDCAPHRLAYLTGLCRKLKLETLFVEEFLGRQAPHFNNDKKMIFIGRERAILEKAAKAWLHCSTDGEWGRLLGYPDCCARAFADWYNESALRDPRPEIITRILLNTKKRPALDFRLNNLWNYFSRMDFNDPKDCSSYRKMLDMNREMDLPSLHVISWHPCSYDCARSREKAGVMFSFMRHHAPGYAAALENMLARPALFWDKFRYAVLEGSVSGNRLEYAAVLPPKTLLSEKMYKLLACCDSVKTGKERTGFYRAGKAVFTAPGPAPEILDFR